MEIGRKAQAKRPAKESIVMCCRACLATDCQLYNMHEHKLVDEFVRVSGFDVLQSGKLPKYLCVICTSLLRKCVAFRDKCRRATMCLLPEFRKGDLTVESIRTIDRCANKLLNLMQTEVEITDTLSTPIMLPDQFVMYNQNDKLNDVVAKLDDIKDEPVIKENNELKNGLYLQIDSANINEIKINVVNKNNLPEESMIETISEDMFKTEYLDLSEEDEFENVSINRLMNINADVNKSVDLDNEISEVCSGGAAEGNQKMSCRSKKANKIKEFEEACNMDCKSLTQEEQLAEIESQRNSASYKQAPYHCHPCGRHYKCKYALDRHMTKHEKKAGDHECPVCTLRFPSNAQLRRHWILNHRFKIVCRECGHVFGAKSKAVAHYEWHVGTMFKCEYCDRIFDKQTSCFSHIRLVHPTMNVACNMCGETFINDKGLNWHKKRAHGVPSKRLKCELCSFKFISLDALKKHKDTADDHADLTPCIQCGENFDSEEKMQEHTMSAHPVCIECDMTFINTVSYDTHLVRKHQGLGRPRDKRSLLPKPPKRPPPPPRPPPPAPVPRPPRRRAPAAPSQVQRTVCCEQCGKTFRGEAMLRLHQEVNHEGIKPTCIICQKTFTQPNTLKLHLRTHTGERPYQCPQCPRAFAVKFNFVRHHKLAHLNIRESFPCPICGRVLTTRGSVRVHIKEVHDGVRPKRIRKRKLANAPPTTASQLAPAHGGERPKLIRKRKLANAPPTTASQLAPAHCGERPKLIRKRKLANAPPTTASQLAPAHGGERPKRNCKRKLEKAPPTPASPYSSED